MLQLGLLPRELTPDSVLAVLQDRIGSANGVTARDLVYLVTGRVSPADERRLRQIIEHLRRQGCAICAHPATGYHYAANATELDRTCEYLLARAMTSLEQISVLKHVPLPNLRGQLGLPLQPIGDPAA